MARAGSRQQISTAKAPSVTIGISLRTSPSALSLSSNEPFYITVEARILRTPHPEKAITLQTYPSPLDSLSNYCFKPASSCTDQNKKIKLGLFGATRRVGVDFEDLREYETFVTIPPMGEGSYTVQHRLDPDRMERAGLKTGERYYIKLKDVCLGTWWFAYGTDEELRRVRLRSWRTAEGEDDRRAEEWHDMELEMEDTDFHEEMEARREVWLAQYGYNETMGEDPQTLEMVWEDISDLEFEVVD